MNKDASQNDSALIRAEDMQLGGRFNWVGLHPNQIKSIATIMAASGQFEDIQKDSAKAYVKILAGQEMGITPFMAMSDINIIEGKATAGGNIYAAKVKGNPKYDYRVKKQDLDGCAIEFFELMGGGKRESLGTYEFTKEDAQAAGLLDPECPDAPRKHNLRKITIYKKGGGSWQKDGCKCKDNWKKYPRAMYFNRAISGGTHTYCPDALNGVNVYTPDELGATVDEHGRVVVENIVDPSNGRTPPKAEPEAVPATAAPETSRQLIASISESLNSKGFNDSAERREVLLSAAGVKDTAALTINSLKMARDSLEGMNGIEIRNAYVKTIDGEIVQRPPADDDTVTDEPETPPTEVAAPVSDKDLENIDETLDANIAAVFPEAEVLEGGIKPSPKKPVGRKLPTKEQTEAWKKYYTSFDLDKDAREEICMEIIGKKSPAMYADYEKLLTELEAN